MNVLFINHKATQCGVYEFGRNLGEALSRSSLTFHYRECNSPAELMDAVKESQPALIIYNYHPATLRWLTSDITRSIQSPQIGIIHEITQQVADRADNSLFNFHIAHDPTLLLKNPLVFKAGRLIPPFKNKSSRPEIPTIGSFGFGTAGKGFEKLVDQVQQEFDEAIIRLSIPFSTFLDADGKNARLIAENCRKLLFKPNVSLTISHEFLEQNGVLEFLAQNSINVFLYEEMGIPRGLSSATDLALAVDRPIAVSDNSMFRHLLNSRPSICTRYLSIRDIIKNGTAPLEEYRLEWSPEILCWDYERIVADVLSRPEIPPIRTISPLTKISRRVKTAIKRRLRMASDEQKSWISDTSIAKSRLSNSRDLRYLPAVLPDNWPLNNILDNNARKIFKTTIDQMFEYLPELMARKIPEANVQQAFVLDTVYKFAKDIVVPKILCVGSFEDSAAESLKALGFDIDEIDPMINYDLAAFITKPTTIKGSYDLIFSTSVIEHVEKDEEFLRDMALLVKKGGKIVLTCDYCDTYKPGDPIFDVDFRFYTQKDIKERLLSTLVDCRLFDEPDWNCPNPDFFYEGLNYTFGTIVLEKI